MIDKEREFARQLEELDRHIHPRASLTQVAGSHYVTKPMQVWDFIHRNGIGYLAGNVIKYVSRYKEKGGIADLEKARHYIEKLIEEEQAPACPEGEGEGGA